MKVKATGQENVN